jgi:pimeloyl-ACP methyl ester carboxylesterase
LSNNHISGFDTILPKGIDNESVSFYYKITNWDNVPEKEANTLTTAPQHVLDNVSVRGTTIRLVTGGKGEPLIYLHGGAGGGRWLPSLEALSNDFSIYAPEHPGFGKSDDLKSIDNMTDLAFFYLDFMDLMKIESAVFVGSSLGGWLALEIAVIAPHRVKQLVLLDSAGLRVEGVKVPDQFIMDPDDVFNALFFDKSIPERIKKMTEGDAEAAEQGIRNRMMTAHLGWNPFFHNPKLRERMHRVTMPALVVWGEQDELFPVAYAYEFEKVLPNAKLAIIPNCGHLPAQEKVDDFAKAALSFLKGGK